MSFSVLSAELDEPSHNVGPKTTTSINQNSSWLGIDKIDLSMVKMKLMDPDEGEGWDNETADRMILEYRKYLLLTKKYPEQSVVPCKMVDKVWHHHILDTRAYVVDCETVFGEFLHHFPYWGMRGEEDALSLYSAYDATLQLYQKHFGYSPDASIWTRTGAARCPNCGRGSCFASGTLIRMKDGSVCPVENLRIGDLTYGGKVTGIMCFERLDDPLFNYEGVLVTGSHAVKEEGRWIRVVESTLAKRIPEDGNHKLVWCFNCEEHMVSIGNLVFADFQEVGGPVVDVVHKLTLAELNRNAAVVSL
jgi:hypothetical protein